MIKPDKVNILGIEYSITYCDKPSDVDVHKYDALWGQTDFWTRSIRIYDNGNRPTEDIWQVIFHEVIHGIADALHIDELKGKDKEDTVDLLALALTDILFRNNWMRID